MTEYHSKYWAHALTLKNPLGNQDCLARSLGNARVDLNPHQIEAALFAVQSPLSKGVILADEVGLGKTIEAGLVIAQRWAERRRKILLVVPAFLRQQWRQELEEKFFIHSVILDGKTFNEQKNVKGQKNPFECKDAVVICSYHFASAKADQIGAVNWDLAVIDEAHRLRNVYKPANKMAKALSKALKDVFKVLLTATPLQNNLSELYGLISVIDQQVFASEPSFREQFGSAKGDPLGFREHQLKERMRQFCNRTLRKQVKEYISFTERKSFTSDFTPTPEEQELYDGVTAFLRRKSSHALPVGQRSLMTLVLQKLLASSSFAIAGTLQRMLDRLKNPQKKAELLDESDFEGLSELADERGENADGSFDIEVDNPGLQELNNEIVELEALAQLAHSITVNAKGNSLVDALQCAIQKAASLGAAEKAVIFTESRRTQTYLFNLLLAAGYENDIVMINGSNTDPLSKQIYESWLKRHAGTDRITGVKAVDMKAAIVEQFRDCAKILIATEAAAEGINLQFCSIVINYDLPWNPQRIEQRIGRCHRYGQKHDVVVVNFLNSSNEADKRVHELLETKLKLFSGVFGSSDEVLGVLESGIDIERRISEIYQTCRTTEEIQSAFDAIQSELEEQIKERYENARISVIENFDEEVGKRLKVRQDMTTASLSQREQWLFDLSRFELNGNASFFPESGHFIVNGGDAIPEGKYFLDWKEAEHKDGIFYRNDHPAATKVIEAAKTRELSPAKLIFDYSSYGQKISAIEPLVGKRGILVLSLLQVQSLDLEEYLVFSATTQHGEVLDDELCQKLFQLPAVVNEVLDDASDSMNALRQRQIGEILVKVGENNQKHFEDYADKLDQWSEDLKQDLERAIKDKERELREAKTILKREARTLEEKLAGQKNIKKLEAERNRKRRELFAAQDRIEEQRDELIERTEKKLQASADVKPLFKIGWEIR